MNDRLRELRRAGSGAGGGGAAGHDIEMGRVDGGGPSAQPQFMNDFFTDVEAVKVSGRALLLLLCVCLSGLISGGASVVSNFFACSVRPVFSNTPTLARAAGGHQRDQGGDQADGDDPPGGVPGHDGAQGAEAELGAQQRDPGDEPQGAARQGHAQRAFVCFPPVLD